jgi:2-methylcitrate dehydratase PrpD
MKHGRNPVEAAMTFDELSDFILGGDIPEAAVDRTALLLIDTLGVAAGAAGMTAGRIAREHAARFMAASAGADGAAMLFDGRRASIPGAGFALASQIDNLDAHDGFNPVKGHIGCAVVPALFAFAEARPDMGAREALAVLAMSYEVAARAGMALHGTVSDYHTSGAWNALGVAALAGRMIGLDPDGLRQALGIAEYHGPRSQMMREIATPTMLHDGSGMGALVGSMAALLAREGFTGAPAITAEAPEAARFWADLGDRWTVLENYIKPYPICRWAHAAIDGVRKLRLEHGVSAETAARIEVYTYDEAAALFPGIPTTTSQAQYALPFPVATMLVHGKVGPEHVAEAALSDPAVAAVLPRITVTAVQRHNDRFPAMRVGDVVIETTDGRRLSSGDVHARGGVDAPMPEAEIEEKFHVMTSSTLPEARSRAIWAMRHRLLEPGTRLADLTALIQGPAELV